MPRVSRRSRSLPLVYPLIALAVGVALLPSALRPPPEQTSDSASLNPNAPPEEQQEQILQALRQAQGGAGNDIGASTTTTTTPKKQELASGRCFGNPLRQTESVYSAPCAPAFTGSNGGVTGKNVFANEVRIGFWHAAAEADEGPIPETSDGNQNAVTRTFRVLQAYVNNRFETYGRKVRFYGLTGSSDPAENQANAKRAWEQHKLFAASHLNLPFCEAFVGAGGSVMCNPQIASTYARNRPGFYSFMLDRTKATGFGAEYVCKNLLGRKAVYSGTERNRDRKISIVSDTSIDMGHVPPEEYQRALKAECGATYNGKSYEMAGGDAGAATAAVSQMRSDGTTTVLLEVSVVNTLLLMTAAQTIGWEPEWVMVSPAALDFSSNARLLPATQSEHLFGMTAWEVPRRIEESECYQAYKQIDPDNDPDDAVCRLMWHQIVLFADAIQMAGPKLDQAGFERGLFKLGHRFPEEPWAIGGGFGTGDYSYMDDVSEVWFSRTAINPVSGQPGAYVYTHGADRFKRGELPSDSNEHLFKRGVTTPGGAEVG